MKIINKQNVKVINRVPGETNVTISEMLEFDDNTKWIREKKEIGKGGSRYHYVRVDAISPRDDVWDLSLLVKKKRYIMPYQMHSRLVRKYVEGKIVQ